MEDYKSVEDVKVGDICFYSEFNEKRPNPSHHYADSVFEIVMDGDIKKARTVVMTNDSGHTFYNYLEPLDLSIPVEYVVSSSTTFKKIGNVFDNPEMLDSDYANTHFTNDCPILSNEDNRELSVLYHVQDMMSCMGVEDIINSLENKISEIINKK